MIQFLGIDFSKSRVHAACLGKDLGLTCEVSTPIAGAERTSAVTTFQPSEWVRAGAYAAQEIYLRLPVSCRKLWGIGLSSPPGWIALDLDFEPLSELRLVPAHSIASDLRQWIQAHPRFERRISAILSPKDFFRFAVSKGLAADATLASRQGLLQHGQLEWSRQGLDEEGLLERWLPPIFESQITTGRISEEGMQKTGLPGGLWLVAGALSPSCAMVASGDLRQGVLWANADHGLLAYGIGTSTRVDARLDVAFELGFSLHRSAIAGHRVLEKALEPPAEPEFLEETRQQLQSSGLPVSKIVQHSGRPEVGAAALAGIGSGLLRSWDSFYKEFDPLAADCERT